MHGFSFYNKKYRADSEIPNCILPSAFYIVVFPIQITKNTKIFTNCIYKLKIFCYIIMYMFRIAYFN